MSAQDICRYVYLSFSLTYCNVYVNYVVKEVLLLFEAKKYVYVYLSVENKVKALSPFVYTLTDLWY